MANIDPADVPNEIESLKAHLLAPRGVLTKPSRSSPTGVTQNHYFVVFRSR